MPETPRFNKFKSNIMNWLIDNPFYNTNEYLYSTRDVIF